MNRKLLAGVVAAVLVAVVAVVWATRGADFPYTADEMQTAVIDCGAEHIAAATPSEQRLAVAESFSTSNLQPCLRDKLPDLTADQVADIDDLIGQQRDLELDED